VRDLVEETFEMPPHGPVLHLRRPPGTAVLDKNAVHKKLFRFCDGRMPYVGILIDLGGYDYRFSTVDLGSLTTSIAAWV
jgi:hypothetical protein